MGVSLDEIVDLRTWLTAVRDIGDLRDVHGADWNLEIGAVSEVNYRLPSPSALLFDQITGYPAGMRVLTSSMSNARRLGLTLRLGTELDDHALVRALRGKPAQWLRDHEHYRARTVDTGPVMEVVERDEEIDLLSFPVPFWHEHDGGRYIGTGCAVFTTDPDTGWVNAGSYRMQVQHARGATINIEAGKHGAMHVREWFARHGRAPVTVTLGGDPLMVVAAGTEVPAGVSELDYVGAIQGRPVDVIPGEVTGLPVPANAEIVVEGWLRPEVTAEEGPFGEWTGYYSGGAGQVIMLEVERVYRRRDPILLGTPPGKPPHDYSYMRSVMKSSMILDALLATGLPEVREVWAHEEGGGRQLLAVSIDQKYAGHARQAGLLTSQLPAAAYMNKFVIVVDSDVDTRSLSEVMWAVCTRTEPAADIEILRKTWGSRVDPLADPGAPRYNTRAVIDACRPFERLADFPVVAEASRELCDRVVAKWPDLLGGR
ncbi:ubiquinone biosynthesis protein UbiD [Actinophytocola xinjiangensis]|uniref:Ubiquinone biosynthesis protein UbiD n=1 Tax=Actinophytocola xinjiangensis TaxID=485602 RepID=A0A7Z0WF90_9PSEU|nr:UbiD family decarboxylase [Actinophytocola xinjiangensis]OLF05970.1 ubiquinone biosynthesis protein UbiD [Actinophytocola xinjiangensis]